MYYIGFDIGGTKCAVSVGEAKDGNITILGREETPTQSSPQDTLAILLPAVKKWQKQYGVTRAGVSCGGPLNSQTGVIIAPPNLHTGWHGFAIVEYILQETGLQSKLQNDANACAVAEWRFGAGRGSKNMIFMTFGSGLGAGLILDGKLYAGANDNAGEVGHIRLAKNGPRGYGKDGSFEGFCSGHGIARLAAQMAARSKNPPAYMQKEGGRYEITTKELAKYAFEGDRFAKRVFAKSGEMLGKGLSIVIDVINPEKIVLGGVFMRSSKLLVPSMRKQIEKEALTESARVCEIVPAQLSENVGDIAALAIAVGD